MGKWSTYSGQHIGTADLHAAISDTLKEYGQIIYKAADEGIEAGAKELVEALKEASPVKTGNFKKNWKYSGKKGSKRRYVGNSTVVYGGSEGKGKSEERNEIALANILEYSTERGRPFIKDTVEKSTKRVARAMVEEMLKNI